MASISTAPTPLQAPSQDSARVLVLGGGVIGLTAAWTLLDQGYKVTLLSEDWASDETALLSSQAAGALWKCLPLECGPQAVTANLSTNQKWTLESYKLFNALAATPEAENVVELRPCTILTTGAIEGNAVLSNKLEFVKKNLNGYRAGSDLFAEYGINDKHAGGLTEAYEYTAPVINVNRALAFMMDLVKSKGAELKTGTIKGDLLEQESELLEEYGASAIVNAMGLGSREAAADPNVYGLHGALLRLVNDGKDFPIVRNAMIVSGTKVGQSGGDGAFILPREDGILALGTISEAKGQASDLTIDSEAVKEMRARCEELLPQLKNARLADVPIITGTRPQRWGGPRVERETRSTQSRIIHSYGHGGAGWSLSVGSAMDVAGLVDEVVGEASNTVKASLGAKVFAPLKVEVAV